MICPSCNTRNNYYHIYCYQCGTKLQNTDEDMPDALPSKEEEANGENHDAKIEVENIMITLDDPKPKKKSLVKPGFILLLSLITLAAAGTGVFFWFHPLKGETKSKAVVQSALPSPKVESITDNGKEAHLFTFYGTAGSIVRFEGKDLAMTNGHAQITIPDEEWLKQPASDPTVTSRTIQLKALLITKDQKESTINLPPFTISIPRTALEIVAPSSAEEETLESSYTLKVKTQPDALLTLNGQEVSNSPDEEGIVELPVAVEPKGENIFTIEASVDGKNVTKKDIIIKRPVMDIPITLDNPAPYSSSSQVYTLTGTTDAGAAITTDAATVGSPFVNPSTGAFRIQIKLPQEAGDYPVTLTAVKDGKKDSSLLIHINKELSEAQYRAQAVPLDYSLLIGNEKAYKDKILLFQGTVTEIVKEDKPPLFILDTGSGETQLLTVEYMGNTTIRKGRRYQFIGELVGKDQGNPKIQAKLAYRFRG